MNQKLLGSPRSLLAKDGFPGPGPGHLALVMARAGTGKSAFLVAIGLDALLAGQRVLHVTVDRTVDNVRTYYDDLLAELVQRGDVRGTATELQLWVERHRHIHTFMGPRFGPDLLKHTLDLVVGQMHFDPQMIVIDGLDLEHLSREMVADIREQARRAGAELWVSCRTHREGPQARAGHLPPPADQMEDLCDLAFLLDQDGQVVRLHVLKDHEEIAVRNTHVLLDPTTLLLVPEPGSPLMA